MEALLQVNGLTKRFGGLTAVERVEFSLYPGEILGLIGPNGAGKTTIFNMITGFYTPTEGEVHFRGQRIGHPPLRVVERLRSGAWWLHWLPLSGIQARWQQEQTLLPHHITQLGIARTFQTIRLFKNLTVLENVMAGLHHRTHSGVWNALVRNNMQKQEETFIREEAERLLGVLHLQGYCNELAKNLPYGDQRRLEIARALATQPTLLVLDEPAAGLNEQETLELEEMVRQIRAGGVTILLIEHDMRMVMSLCERIVVVDHGRKIAAGTPTEIQNNPEVIRAYLGEEEL